MEKLVNHYDKEYMKMAMLKHEETFREQVYELHRLYRIQKMLMKDIGRTNPHYARPDPSRYRVESADDESDQLELTLGPRSYHHKKIKAAEPGQKSDSGPSFSSSSTGSSQITGTRKDEFLITQQKSRAPEARPVSNQDRLNSPPWLFQALTLNIT